MQYSEQVIRWLAPFLLWLVGKRYKLDVSKWKKIQAEGECKGSKESKGIKGIGVIF